MSGHGPRFLRLALAARNAVREVSASEVPSLVEGGAVLVDVREEGECAAGHILGATLLGKGVLERDVERLFPDPDAELLLYCGSGLRSALAAESLQRMGYRRVASVEGGVEALAGLLPTSSR